MHPDRHQRRSIRLPHYDYSQNGYYYVTICTPGKTCLFGKIAKGRMRLNRSGRIVLRCWFSISEHFSHIDLDLFVIMPNHLHGIIHIADTNHHLINKGRGGVTPPLQKLHTPTLSHIVGYFKYHSTKRINRLLNTPGKRIWQRSFYDRVIRSEAELNAKRDYILNNPLKWELDRNNPTNW